MAYLRAILNMTFLIYLQLWIIVLLFNLQECVPLSANESRASRYIKLIVLLIPVFLPLYFGVKEKKLEALHEKLGYAHYDKEVGHRALLFTYLIVCFIGVMALAVLKKHTS